MTPDYAKKKLLAMLSGPRAAFVINGKAIKVVLDALEAAENLNAEINLRNTALTAKIEPMGRQVDELTMWVKRLAYSLRNARPDSKLHGAAMDYLSRKGLISVEDVLR